MIHIGAEANVREINERSKHASRPINVHMVKCLTVLGVKLERFRLSRQTKSPRKAKSIADAWAKVPMSKRETITVWTD